LDTGAELYQEDLQTTESTADADETAVAVANEEKNVPLIVSSRLVAHLSSHLNPKALPPISQYCLIQPSHLVTLLSTAMLPTTSQCCRTRFNLQA